MKMSDPPLRCTVTVTVGDWDPQALFEPGKRLSAKACAAAGLDATAGWCLQAAQITTDRWDGATATLELWREPPAEKKPGRTRRSA